MPASDAEVVVVGGGASGLAVAAALARAGTPAVVLDEDARIGGTWVRRYDRLCLHTARAFSGLPYLGLPRSYPRYVPKDLYAAYLEQYATRLRLDVRLGERVERIAPSGRRWSLQTADGRWTARAVVVATGRHRVPRLPGWAEARTFGGRLLHSSAFRSGRDARGLRTLVVGLGNSGAEIAADLVEHGAARVAVSVRRPPPITRRELAGVPVQLLGILLAPLPARAVDAAGAFLRRAATRDLAPYGLAREAWGPFAERRPPVIDTGFVRHLRAGSIDVRPAVRALTPTGAVFADGRQERFDVVVAATGFRTGLGSLVDVGSPLGDGERPPANGGLPAGVFFAGFREGPRGQLFEARREAPAVARAVIRELRAGPR